MLRKFFKWIKHIWTFEARRREEDDKLVERLKDAKWQEKVLHDAVERGEPVDAEHEKIKQELQEIRSRLPYGDSIAFSKFVLLCALFYIILNPVYSKFVSFMQDMAIGPLYNVYYQENISFWTVAFMAGHLLTTWSWLSLTAMEFVPALWIAQRMLRRPDARALIKVFAILVCIAFVILLIAPFSFLMVQISVIE